MVSSDWNECLCLSTPFDPISFVYPELAQRLEAIFKRYTGNIMSLGEAAHEVMRILPSPLTEAQMDSYLDASFRPYKGVPELIRWCLEKGILFVINTTAFQGYFQRALARGLIPAGTVIAANPSICYDSIKNSDFPLYSVNEIEDKAAVSQIIMESLEIPPSRVVVMGDSGGDGPHFAWGASVGAFLIGSMTKPSLERFCSTKGVTMDLRFGLTYAEGSPRDTAGEMRFDFMALAPVIESVMAR
jgi:phosphoserine phosphatase